MSSPSTTQPETTFRAFTNSQGSDYAKYRRDYHPSLYHEIIDYHTSKHGELNTLLDIGCGPGIAVRTFAKNFKHAIGIDASEGMIATAKSLGGKTSTSEPIRFEVSMDFGKISTCLMAARLLKPAGTVAIWTGACDLKAAPPTPRYEEVTNVMQKMMHELNPYETLGNKVNVSLYVDLRMPWMLEKPVMAFKKRHFGRVEWGTGAPSALPGNEFLAEHKPQNLDSMEMMLGTWSAVVRWREANKEKVKTEEDVVRKMRRGVEGVLRGVGVGKGEELVWEGVEGALLLCRRT
ncbi:hypothetical protein EYR41_011789 [Orbilia oligospora]|uniref:Methyltransferase domain-containing protein n=1 Tax=Orbilia oligospora TaxID=2813651 RepID=A0A7C8PL19_ORBOL|nr:hypothetical protein TWF751_003081 [Orbilia oligospora]TGJ62600.1 hypothetical protein EYR41_011789 [Orbilia oligospora]